MRSVIALCLAALFCFFEPAPAANRLQTPGYRAVNNQYAWYYNRPARNRSEVMQRAGLNGSVNGWPNCRRVWRATDTEWTTSRGMQFSGWTVRRARTNTQPRCYGFSGRYGAGAKIIQAPVYRQP